MNINDKINSRYEWQIIKENIRIDAIPKNRRFMGNYKLKQTIEILDKRSNHIYKREDK